jgi:hypothetical protein
MQQMILKIQVENIYFSLFNFIKVKFREKIHITYSVKVTKKNDVVIVTYIVYKYIVSHDFILTWIFFYTICDKSIVEPLVNI